MTKLYWMALGSLVVFLVLAMTLLESSPGTTVSFSQLRPVVQLLLYAMFLDLLILIASVLSILYLGITLLLTKAIESKTA